MEPRKKLEVMLKGWRGSELPKPQRDTVGQPFRNFVSNTLCFLNVLRAISGQAAIRWTKKVETRDIHRLMRLE